MVLRIFLGIVLGILTTLFSVQNDPWVQNKVGIFFQNILSQTLDCDVSCAVEFFDVIHPRLYLRNLAMQDRDATWKWHADSYRSGFSWIDVMKTRCIPIWAQAKDVNVYSQLNNGNPAIAPHIKELIKGPDLPIPLFITQAKFRNTQCVFFDGVRTITNQWHCDAHKQGDCFQLTFRVLDGSIAADTANYLSDIKGSANVVTKEKNKEIEFSAQLDLQGALPQLGAYPTCYFSGHWNKNRGRFQLESIDQTLRINPLVIAERDNDTYVEATASIPIDVLYKLAMNSDHSPLGGSCAMRFKGSLADDGYSEGMIISEDIQHSLLMHPTVCSLVFSKRAQCWGGTWAMKHGVYQSIRGSFDWHAGNNQAHFFAENESEFVIPYFSHYRLNPHDVHLHCSYNGNDQMIHGAYAMNATHNTLDHSLTCSGAYALDAHDTFHLDGAIGKYTYECTGSLSQKCISALRIGNCDDQTMAELHYDTATQHYSSSVNFSLVHALCNSFLHHDLHGQGTLCAQAHRAKELFYVDFSLKDATIRLPQTYNFISDASLQAIVDVQQRRLSIDDLACTMHNGVIKSSHGVLWFDEGGGLQFAHVPLLVDRCLVTAHQDLFAVLSGNLLFSKQKDSAACIAGNLMINRAQLKENLFSQQLQKKLFSVAHASREKKEIPIECDVTIETKDPIRVDTPFLQANAQVDVHVTGNVFDPRVEGSVLVPSGTIRFPYQPLHITKGELMLSHDQPNNPHVQLTAKNSIKNHLIALHITGSLQDTTILLESTPPLSNEQIVGLLIAGAHEDTLDALIPALLMQNVTNYIFSSHSSNFYDRFIKPWMQKINVNLKPNFSDQSGRGGIRGTLEIVVNDRWRAFIEKNFSLTEDTHFELEYILSDDITFRVLRDERRDIGGEVEMRWKF